MADEITEATARRPLRILFVCTGNSARSQMAEAFARRLGRGAVAAHSAGVDPTRLNPHAVAAMRERRIDVSHQTSKALDEALARRMDYVITVCGHAEERCPILPPEVRRIHWPLGDPARAQGTPEEVLRAFRRSRDEIETRVRGLFEEILGPGPPVPPSTRPA